MVFLLSSENVFDYLSRHDLLNSSTANISKIEKITAKNFNLLITLENNQLLVKQEMCDKQGKVNGDFLKEWQIQEVIRKFPQLGHLSNFIPDLVWFDRENSLIVFRYLNNYLDLYNFYTQVKSFPVHIAAEIGKTLAVFHRDSYDCQNYREFLVTDSNNQIVHQVNRLIRSWERIEPEICR